MYLFLQQAAIASRYPGGQDTASARAISNVCKFLFYDVPARRFQSVHHLSLQILCADP